MENYVHLTHTLDDATKMKTTKILNFQLWKLEVPKQNNLLVSAITANSQDTGDKKKTTQLKHFRCLQPSNQTFEFPPISQKLGLQGSTVTPPNPSS